ncbi:hypothetical protein BJ138DRAFT_1066029 [Hygrophoropsis aurantiaca]|uniref:Uncharacterized protein n=1 Tax=Hygrophoropsis aurantiaca TaxID=72124 RepID=A0ACB8AAB2_9AGAM|nr:hypothetical protein BJ138DRAFT_1066029 [Hygrophoropsis aurantiaca]
MAVLAPQDWHPPRDHTMDLPATPNSAPRQRSSSTNDRSSSPPQHNLQHQQPYPYPVQQQPQGGWTPSISAQPFYPSFYQNQHQQSYSVHGHPQQQQQVPQQNPYFDPAANAQLAQWAYQQMVYNAQQQAHQMQQHIPTHMSPIPAQRTNSSPAPSTPNEYFTQNQLFSPFPSGTPPPHQVHHSNSYGGSQRSTSSEHAGQPQHNGFHPYRRPNRSGTPLAQDTERRAGGPSGGTFQPPYARGDASASTTSVNSGSSHGHGSRQRTSSNQGSSNGHANGGSAGTANPSLSGTAGSVRSRNGPPQPSPPTIDSPRVRTGSNSSSASGGAGSAPRPHHRTTSSSSTNSSSTPRPSVSTSASTSTSSTHNNSAARPARPSPLSQGNFTAAEKRMSRDDSDLAAMLEPTSSAAVRSSGLKGRLRRALSMNSAQVLEEEDDDETSSIKATSSRKLHPKPSIQTDSAKAGTSNGGSTSPDVTDGASTTVPAKKKSRAASLFNSRLNASTDNISLSSTMSSASVVIRKLGSIGKLARRNSLAGITSLFKDKKDKEAEEGAGNSSKKKKKKDAKGQVAEPTVSHAVAELERSSDWSAPELNGLSPAAKLARQHTLKSNAEAVAKAKALEAANIAAAAAQKQNGAPVPMTWEKNTTSRGDSSPVKPGLARVSEDGTRVIVEEEDSDSEDGHTYGQPQPGPSFISDGWDDDEVWNEDGEEDITIRGALESTTLGDGDHESVEWATNIRRSIERTKAPTKGILKVLSGAGSYSQDAYSADLLSNPAFNRVRSNSYNSPAGQTSELGPLAHIPSPDPDHIDGLHRHPSHSSAHSNAGGKHSSLLPPLELGASDGLGIDSPKDMMASGTSSSHHPPEKSMFTLPNSSAPALSTMPMLSPPTLTHRSATSPPKRLVFANNLSVYDTFSASVYDRRSEPATWSRLTPALAQRIKEELNSYKMEEMEVHASSRMHTQFFI